MDKDLLRARRLRRQALLDELDTYWTMYQRNELTYEEYDEKRNKLISEFPANGA